MFFIVIQGYHIVNSLRAFPNIVSKSCTLAKRLHASSSNDEIATTTAREDGRIPCFYKPNPNSRGWKERIHIEDLKLGQEISGYVVQDLLKGKTGPKIFFECGVGSTDRQGEWRIVNGMLRLDRSRISVARKRATRLRKRDQVDLYVSRIQLDCDRFEVCTDPDVVDRLRKQPDKVPISSLPIGIEVKGEVVAVRSYGVLVDIGANRNGLLHIQKVANLYGRYIEKEKGLVDAGLERGARLRLKIESNEKKRLYLDFTDDVKQEAEEELSRLGTKVGSESQPGVERPKGDTEQMSEEILSEWAEFAAQSETSSTNRKEEKDNRIYDSSDDDDDDDDDDDYDDYDEDRDIEDSLGLGSY